jgi:hypothetical protein
MFKASVILYVHETDNKRLAVRAQWSFFYNLPSTSSQQLASNVVIAILARLPDKREDGGV